MYIRDKVSSATRPVKELKGYHVFKGYLPNWMPFVGGEYFTFFNPVFNFADVAISTGVGLLLVYNHRNSSSKQNLN
jgi:signal peptidase II